jgi:hypothetical protein
VGRPVLLPNGYKIDFFLAFTERGSSASGATKAKMTRATSSFAHEQLVLLRKSPLPASLSREVLLNPKKNCQACTSAHVSRSGMQTHGAIALPDEPGRQQDSSLGRCFLFGSHIPRCAFLHMFYIDGKREKRTVILTVELIYSYLHPDDKLQSISSRQHWLGMVSLKRFFLLDSCSSVRRREIDGWWCTGGSSQQRWWSISS